MESARNTHQSTDFKKLFLVYTLSAIGIALLLSLLVEVVLLRNVSGLLRSLMQTQDWQFVRLLGLVFVAAVLLVPPLIFLATLALAAVQFGKRLAKWYRPPLQDLRRAVEKIKQQDLDFTIGYDGPDELGDLCRAFNELRSQLQASLLREWSKEEEAREMVAALSHDLRTPVAILQGYVENLVGARPAVRAERLERYLPVLESSTQRLTHLLDDMLMVASLDQSSFVLHPYPVNLKQELERKAAEYTLRCKEQSITFQYRAWKLSELEGDIMLDYRRIEQVLDNLFENALRFTPSDGSITLTWTRDRNMYRFCMSDTGTGIDETYLPHIFEKYYSRSNLQASRRGTHKKSMGMGLYICKELVRLHGGAISARNLPEGGCELSFWITPYAELKRE